MQKSTKFPRQPFTFGKSVVEYFDFLANLNIDGLGADYKVFFIFFLTIENCDYSGFYLLL